MTYVNLGCGGRVHPAWVNIDMVAAAPGVIAHDLTRGIPLASGTCDVVYHSHVLEHLRRPDAERFMGECYRVLRPGGVLRVAVPDLERICRTYLARLETAFSGDPHAADDYDWIMLEMYDQAVREETGGGMKRYLEQPDLRNESFVFERIGEEGCALVQALRNQRTSSHEAARKSDLRTRARFLARAVRQRARLMMRRVPTEGARRLGRFRLGGEVHQWMYDRFSLGRLMASSGFADPIVQSATSSLVEGWEAFQLDTLSDGRVRKPDSMYMEARRPADKASEPRRG